MNRDARAVRPLSKYGVQDKHFFLPRRLVAEGAGEDESADNAFRVFSVNTYLKARADFLVWKEQTR